MSDTETRTKREVRPLTAEEWNGLLSELNYTLRVTDGTKEGSWYFWCEQKHDGGTAWLHARRFIWTEGQQVGTAELADALEGDVTTQLVKREEVPVDGE